jgi:hypothetical protein
MSFCTLLSDATSPEKSLAAGILIGALVSPLGGSGAAPKPSQAAPAPVAASPGVGTFPLADRAAPFAAGRYCSAESDVISGKLLAVRCVQTHHLTPEAGRRSALSGVKSMRARR